MAKSRQTITPIPVAPPPEIDDPVAETEAARVLARIEAAKSEGGPEDFKVSVYQYIGPNKMGLKMPYIMSCDVDDIPRLPETLQERVPDGGRFQVRVTKDGKVFGMFHIETAPQPMHLRRREQAPEPERDDNMPMMMMMQRMMEESRTFMGAMLERLTAAPAVDPSASLTNTLALMRQIQDMAPKADPQIGMTMFDKGFELASKVHDAAGGGEGGGKTGLIDLAREFISGEGGQKLLGTLASSITAPAPQQPQNQPQPRHRQIGPVQQGRPGQQQQRAPQQQQPPAPAPAPQPNPMDDAMAQLFSHAKIGTDPGFIADQLLNTLPEQVMAMLESQEDVVSYLAGLYPEVANYRPWFQAVVDGMWEPDNDAASQGAPPIAANNA